MEDLGGRALVLPTDVADFAQVDAAAEETERAFGQIDVWINVAFTSVFASFTEIRPEEFRRVTEVTYLGYVHGTKAALSRMLPRDEGVIVQVGSALGSRSVPLQSAYCGAKHAINGFTSSVRTELLHRRSRVRLTVVQMPALNTPQFSWVFFRLPNEPRPVAPIYQPEAGARAVLYAADHPRRKQYFVGASTVATILAEKVASGLLDRCLARTGYAAQQRPERAGAGRRSNLWEPVDGEDGLDHGAHGAFDDRSRAHSPQAVLARYPALLSAALTGAAAVGGAMLRRRRGRPGPRNGLTSGGCRAAGRISPAGPGPDGSR